MKEILPQIVKNLLTVKSLITLPLTAVFCVMAVRGLIPTEFMTIYTMIVGFYFGTQAGKP